MLCSIVSMLFPPIKIIDSDVFYWENEFNQQFSSCYAVVASYSWKRQSNEHIKAHLGSSHSLEYLNISIELAKLRVLFQEDN